MPPLGDGPVIAAEQDIRHTPRAVFDRPRVLGPLDQPAGEAIVRGAVDNEGHWRILSPGEPLPRDGRWRQTNLWQLGRIPYRNIRAYDLKGDEYYNFPHMYCAFADNGEPYEAVRYAIVADDGHYDWPLDCNKRIS